MKKHIWNLDWAEIKPRTPKNVFVAAKLGPLFKDPRRGTQKSKVKNMRDFHKARIASEKKINALVTRLTKAQIRHRLLYGVDV